MGSPTRACAEDFPHVTCGKELQGTVGLQPVQPLDLCFEGDWSEMRFFQNLGMMGTCVLHDLRVYIDRERELHTYTFNRCDQTFFGSFFSHGTVSADCITNMH